MARRLSVDHPRSQLVDVLVTGAIGAGQAVTDLVLQPAAQLGDPSGDLDGPVLGAARGRLLPRLLQGRVGRRRLAFRGRENPNPAVTGLGAQLLERSAAEFRERVVDCRA